ncbi:hypothetical protein AXF42_Ash000459 [Apostasia shenzhenica]|uniref:Coenzyme Q-binding protein COQ10 START domain-containing protein n=1 Tax=Apostasia shenzhenica TaxID=1088818 RepID=A0A2I0AGF3_9ASPA|nr:hypothetical protein AXF42_Ash000459 [Apostasia shenzhenica]
MLCFPSSATPVGPALIFSHNLCRTHLRSLFSFSVQSHGGFLPLCRRSSSILFKSSHDPIKFSADPSPPLGDIDAGGETVLERAEELEGFDSVEGFRIEVQKVSGKKNRRKIRSRVLVDAELETVWRVLTDYEGLASFIPSLAVSQLLEKRQNFAKLYQVGEQNLPFGLKFNAKGVLECFEGDLEDLPFGQRRDIEFKMVEGDFQTFEGRWSIVQGMLDVDAPKSGEHLAEVEHRTTLSYVVELEPKIWLPVRLIEGRLVSEVKINVLCVRDEAQRIQRLQSENSSCISMYFLHFIYYSCC